MSWQPLHPTTPHRNGVEIDIEGEEQFANDKYVVTRRRMTSTNPDTPDAMHLSIRNQDRSTRHDWRDFQRIKNQLCGPEWEAIEVYPAESRLVDMANQYHLFAYPFSLGIGFNVRLVGNQHQANIVAPGAVQRDPESVDLQFGGLSKLKDMLEQNPPYKPTEADNG